MARNGQRGLAFAAIEQVEPRQLLSVAPPVQIGSVYYQYPDDSGNDMAGNQIEITFAGSAGHATDRLGDRH